MSAMRPSMIALVSTRIRGTDCGAAIRGASTKEADVLGRGDEVVALRDRQPDHRQPEEQRDPERREGADRARRGSTAAGRRRSPSSSPMNRPMIAVTNSAVDSCWTARSAAIAGITVRYGRSVKPTHDPGHDPRDDQQRRARNRLEHCQLRDDEDDPDETAECGPEEMDGSDQTRPRVPAIKRQRPLAGRRRSPLDRRVRQTTTRVQRSTVTAVASIAARRRRPARFAARPAFTGPAERRAERIAEVRDRARPASRGRPMAPPSRATGTIARSKPEPRRLAQATLQSGDRPQLAEQPDLADRDRPRVDRAVAERGGERQRDGQVEARLGDAQAAGEIRVDVVAPERDPGPPAEDGQQEREPRRIDARCAPRGRRVAGLRDERLDLDEQRPAALHRRRDHAARRARRRAPRGTPARDRRPPGGPTRPSRARPARRSSRSGSCWRERAASRRRARRRGR